jgi:hypothetical protein
MRDLQVRLLHSYEMARLDKADHGRLTNRWKEGLPLDLRLFNITWQMLAHPNSHMPTLLLLPYIPTIA